MRGLCACLLFLLQVCLQGICSALDCTVVPGKLAQIDAGNGQVFGVSSADQIYTLYGNSWVQVSGALKHVSVGPAGLAGVNKHGTIYKMVGGTWTQVTGLLKQLDMGGDQIVVGVNSQNHVFCLSKSAAVLADGSSPLPWVHIAGEMIYYSCGALGCWAVNASHHIFYRHGVTPGCCSGSSWEQVPGQVSMIEAGTDGSVYGLTHEGRIYRREGITPCNPIGTRWVWLGVGNGHGKITHISYDLNYVWALDHTGKILKCKSKHTMPNPFCKC